MKIFGVNEFAARFPNAIFGIAALLILYSIGQKLFDKNFFRFMGSRLCRVNPLPISISGPGILDPLFNLFMFISVWYIYRSFEKQDKTNYYFLPCGVLRGLRFLLKDPVGLLLPGLTYIIFNAFVYRSSGLKIVQMICLEWYQCLLPESGLVWNI